MPHRTIEPSHSFKGFNPTKTTSCTGAHTPNRGVHLRSNRALRLEFFTLKMQSGCLLTSYGSLLIIPSHLAG